MKLLPASLLGGITGAWLLLHLPEKVFHYVAPPSFWSLPSSWWCSSPNCRHGPQQEENPEHAIRDRSHGFLLVVLVYLAGVYGGYFVAAQGILLVGILGGVFLSGTMQNANAMKNILVLGVNMVAAISYLIFAFDRINWLVVLLIAVSSTIGGLVGSKVGRKLSPKVLRAVIFTLGIVALGFMVANLLK